MKNKSRNKGKNNPMWRGGKIISSGGYIMCRCVDHPRAKQKGYYVFEHILVVEKHIGRYLKIGKEVVHHINGNIKDNRLKNLVVITPRKHSQLHYPEYRKNGFGFFKGQKKSVETKQGISKAKKEYWRLWRLKKKLPK